MLTQTGTKPTTEQTNDIAILLESWNDSHDSIETDALLAYVFDQSDAHDMARYVK